MSKSQSKKNAQGLKEISLQPFEPDFCMMHKIGFNRSEGSGGCPHCAAEAAKQQQVFIFT